VIVTEATIPETFAVASRRSRRRRKTTPTGCVTRPARVLRVTETMPSDAVAVACVPPAAGAPIVTVGTLV
jgi:hypothetical protein